MLVKIIVFILSVGILFVISYVPFVFLSEKAAVLVVLIMYLIIGLAGARCMYKDLPMY